MELKPMALLTAVGGVCGGAIAGLVGGSAAIPAGIKVGSACGIRVAVVNKGEEAVDATAKKVGEAGSAAADAVGAAAQATAKEIKKLTDKASIVFEDIADIWSKLCLTGYAISLGLNGASEAMKNFQSASCTSTFESPNCFSISLTHISLNTAVMVMGMLLAHRIYKMARSS